MFEYTKSKGAACHQRKQGQIPIGVVTTLKHDEILFAHIPLAGSDSNWVIQSISSTVQRFWTTSTATITITCPAEYPNFFPPPLPIIKQNTKQEHFLQQEDEICIWLGYVDQLYLNPEDLPKLMEGDDPRLLRVFVGVIDTIGIVGTDKGFKYTIQCRDRMRYLMDTRVTLSPFDAAQDKSFMNKALGGSDIAVVRSMVILKLAQLGIGYVEQLGKTPLNLNGISIIGGKIQDLGLVSAPNKGQVSVVTDSAGNTTTTRTITNQGTPVITITKETAAEKIAAALKKKTAFYTETYLPPDFFYNHANRPLAGGISNRILDLSATPLFNIMTSRPAFNTETVTRAYTIEEQVPIEIIKFLSNQEVYQTEVFCSHVDGNYYYIPRSGDMSGLNDDRRFNRTYYYRYAPPGLANLDFINRIKLEGSKYPDFDFTDIGDPSAKPPIPQDKVSIDVTRAFRTVPDYGQAILNWKQDVTTVAMITNFIVSNSSPTAQKEGGKVLVHMSARPAFLSGLDIAGRNKYIIDETIATVTEATAVAAQVARLHSKDLRAGAMTLIGDPSLVPGEIVQVVGNPMYPHLTELPEIIRERKAAYDYLQVDNTNYLELLTAIKSQDANSSISIPVIGSNELSNGNRADDPTTATANIQGKVVSNSKSAVDVIAGAADANASTLILKGPAGKVGAVKLEEAQKVIDPARSGATEAVTAPAGTFYYPASQKYPVTSPFGMRTHPIKGVKRLHAGIDLGLPEGTPVYAANSGTVVKSINQGVKVGYGEYIVIDHNNGYQTLYGHLKERKVVVGTIVSAGTLIALSGNTGGSTGAHLHFEIKQARGGEYVAIDPKDYLSSAKFATSAKLTTANQPSTITAKQGVKLGLSAGHVVDAVGTGEDILLPPIAYNGNEYSAEGFVNVLTVEAAVAIGKSKGYDVQNLIGAYTKNKKTKGVSALDANISERGALGDHLAQLKAADPNLSIIELHRDDKTVGTPGLIYRNKAELSPGELNLLGTYHTHSSNEKGKGYALPRRGIPILEVSKLTAASGLGQAVAKYQKSKSATDLNAVKEFANNDALGIIDAFFTGVTPTGGNPAADSLGAQTTTNPTTPTTSTSTPASPTQTPLEENIWRRSHFAQDPVSMFRVDAVKHNFNNAGMSGYTTEVVLMSIQGG